MDKVEKAVIELNGEWPKNEPRGTLLFCKKGAGRYRPGEYAGGPSVRPSFEHWDVICTHSEFMETRNRLENKPSWDDAPEWAQWLAQDKDGEWMFYKSEPSMSPLYFHSPDYNVYALTGRVFGDWRNTLERRPESEASQEAEPESVEWDGEGLPPVGTKCKLWESRWVSGPFDAVELSAGAEVEIGGHANFGGFDVACFARDGRTGTAVPDCFVPIQSHRDKVIEAAFEVGASRTPVLDSHVRLVVEALADEDMLKLPEEQE